MKHLLLISALLFASPALAVGTTASTDADALAASLSGTGFNVISAVLTSNTQNGFFTGGSTAIGIDKGVVLTTGQLGCVGSANNSSSCSGSGNSATLSIDFTLDGDSLFFNYAFGSEEYNEFVGTSFNDKFELLLDGVNLAQLPGGGVVSINNVNASTNSAFYRNNSGAGSLDLPIELDGLTTVLTASAMGIGAGTHNLTFSILDVGDSSYDSAVFIQGGSVGITPPVDGVPEPATWAMMIGGFGLVGTTMRRRYGARGNASLA